MRKHIILFVIGLKYLIISLNSFAVDADSIMIEANQAYIRGEYSYASELYEEILSSGLHSSDLYYNLGNAYFKQNMLANAILNYERAWLLKPFDEQIEYNLELARSRTVDRIEQVPEIFYKRWWKRFILGQSVDGWAKTGLTMLVFSFILILWYFFSPTSRMKKLTFFAAIALTMITLVSFFAAQRQYSQVHQKTDAIVFAPRVTVKSAPADTSPDLFVIHEGTKVRITNELGGWAEIRLENGHVGWLQREFVRAVRASGTATP